MTTISVAFSQALQYHQAGQLAEAEQLYRQILQYDPNHADALHLLGEIAYRCRHYQTAIEYMSRAVELNPHAAWFHCNLGMVYQALGREAEALACYQQALQLQPNYPEANNNLATVLRNHGRLDEAIANYRQALSLKPDYAAAHKNLGNALADQGRLDEAVASYRRAIECWPQFADAYNDLGRALAAQGKIDEAMVSIRESIRLEPNDPRAHNNLGVLLARAGRLHDANACYRQAVALNPDFADAYWNWGLALNDLGDLEPASICLREATRIDPDNPQFHASLAEVLARNGDLQEAVDCYDQALRLKPSDALAHINRGAALMRLSKPHEALVNFREAERLDPRHPLAHNNLGSALNQLGQYEEAIASFREALRLRPDDPKFHYNLANALTRLGHWDEALTAINKGLALQPDDGDLHFLRATVWLQQGHWEQAWPEYECRWQAVSFGYRPPDSPVWDGSSVPDQTILVYPEQGLGDMIMLARYFLRVRQRCGRVAFICPAPLRRLFGSCPGIDCLVEPDSLPGPIAAHVGIFSLPGIFRTTPAAIPAPVPYLFADEALTTRWRRERGQAPGRKVGIFWRGSVTTNYPHRTIALDRFSRLAAIDGVQLCSLQKGHGIEELAHWSGPAPPIDLGSRLDDFMDTAAVLGSLDLLITGDTAVAHLAGALGFPVWVLLPSVADWRWLSDREDNPWYPTMRLFRQKKAGDWDEVFERVAAALCRVPDR